MSNFTLNPRSCRVDFWKESGKWYTTEEVIFRISDYNDALIHSALRNALKDSGFEGRYKNMRVTCLKPYHQYSHPISLIWEG